MQSELLVEELKKYYTLDGPEEIEFFLLSHPAVGTKLVEVANYIKNYLPEAQLSLKVLEGAEVDWFKEGEEDPKLLVFIRLMAKPDKELIKAYLSLWTRLEELYSAYDLIFFGAITTKKLEIDIEQWNTLEKRIIEQEDETSH